MRRFLSISENDQNKKKISTEKQILSFTHVRHRLFIRHAILLRTFKRHVFWHFLSEENSTRNLTTMFRHKTLNKTLSQFSSWHGHAKTRFYSMLFQPISCFCDTKFSKNFRRNYFHFSFDWKIFDGNDRFFLSTVVKKISRQNKACLVVFPNVSSRSNHSYFRMETSVKMIESKVRCDTEFEEFKLFNNSFPVFDVSLFVSWWIHDFHWTKLSMHVRFPKIWDISFVLARSANRIIYQVDVFNKYTTNDIRFVWRSHFC